MLFFFEMIICIKYGLLASFFIYIHSNFLSKSRYLQPYLMYQVNVKRQNEGFSVYHQFPPRLYREFI